MGACFPAKPPGRTPRVNPVGEAKKEKRRTKMEEVPKTNGNHKDPKQKSSRYIIYGSPNKSSSADSITTVFADQYYHIYNARLEWARERLKEKARAAWGQVKYVPLEQLNASLGNTEVYVIGTLFKVMPKQYSILKDDQEPVNDANLTSDEDTMVLHETDENVQIIGEIDIHEHVTGIPVALIGFQVNGGAKFHATGACYAGLDLSVYSVSKSNGFSRSKGDKVLIVSGLQFGLYSDKDSDKSSRFIEGLKKLRDYIMDRSQKVVKVIVAGNSIAPGYTKAKAELLGASEIQDRKSISQVFELLDKYIFTLAQSGSDIDMMPGKNDPTSYLLPQQPFHPRILPRSGSLEKVHPVTNPCIFSYRNLTILGTSGENVDAIKQHSRIEFSTTALKSTLEWGHVAPLAPDNLGCFPYKDQDPFVIDFEPDVYFAGNQQEFAVTTYSTSSKTKIQLISVPTFEASQGCVTVDLESLEVEFISFIEE